MTDLSDRTFIKLSPDVRRLLDENGISLRDILNKHPFAEGEVQEITDPGSGKDGAKEVATIILATAAAVAVLTPLIVKAIDVVARRPLVVEDVELVPTLDATGKPILSRSGEPVLYWRRTKKFLEPNANETPTSTTVKGLGLEITLGA